MQPTYCFHCFARMGEHEQVCQHCGTRKGHLISLKRWLLVSSLLILLTVGLFEGAWWLYGHNVYTSYQPARCTIISGQVQDTSGSDYSYELPAFTYTVSAPGRDQLFDCSNHLHVDGVGGHVYTLDTVGL